MKQQEPGFNEPSYNIIPSQMEGDTFYDSLTDFSIPELLKGVHTKLYPLYEIDCATLVLYDKDLSYINSIYVSELLSGCISCKRVNAQPVYLSGITKEISAFEFPVLRSQQEWMAGFGADHQIENQKASYQFNGYIPVEHNGQVYGTFGLHNLTHELNAESLTFCCNVADFIAGLLSVTTEKVRAVEADELRVEPLSVTKVNSGYQEHIKQLNEEINSLSTRLEEFLVYKEEVPLDVITQYGMVGSSMEMQTVFNLLNRISTTETAVLILGETGTGKELIARAVHNASLRASANLIKVNCAAIPPNLIESELFGHEKGSFTGATEKRIGKFELAHKGTIFLDEVGELPLDLQVKLLRVLQEKEIERIGGKKTIYTDVRIISATNRNLLAEVEAGRFRQDLFYRLNVFPITLPPLKARRADIPLLASHFLDKFAKKSNRLLEGFSKKAVSMLMNYSWPGNVRELEHLIERHVVMSQGKVIKTIELPDQSGAASNNITGPVKTIFENERDHIFEVLELCNGRISGANGAARILGVPATTLNSKIKRLGLAKRHII